MIKQTSLLIWKERNPAELIEAIIDLKKRSELEQFLRDLLTEKEIKELSLRWRVARMLQDKVSYEQIEKQTHMSSTTIARIHKWMKQGAGGYNLVLKKLT